MALARWVPFEFSNEPFEALVRRTFGDYGSGWMPALDASVEGEELHVRLELPGIDPDADVDIEVDNGVLRVSGERRSEETKEDNGWSRKEMRYGRFERRVALPDGVDAEAVRATYDAGILDVTVPLPAQPKTKVKVGVGTEKQLKS